MDTRVDDEAEALSAIYGDQFCRRGRLFEVDVAGRVKVIATLPQSYPDVRPQLTVHAIQCTEKQRLELAAVAESAATEGEVCVFDVVAAVANHLEEPGEPDVEPAIVEHPTCKSLIVEGPSLVDRKSTFQSFLARVSSQEDVVCALGDLLARPKLARATHNMYAYRYVDDNTGCLRADNDDDGEHAAGTKIAHLLDVFAADGVLVMVSRWYGGIHLGPDRFKHIAKLAQGVLEDAGFRRPRR